MLYCGYGGRNGYIERPIFWYFKFFIGEVIFIKKKVIIVIFLFIALAFSGCDMFGEDEVMVEETEEVEIVEVNHGTSSISAKEKLPDEINVTINGEKEKREVTWEASDNFDSSEISLHEFSGSFSANGTTGETMAKVVVRREGEEPYSELEFKDEEFKMAVNNALEEQNDEPVFVEDALKIEELEAYNLEPFPTDNIYGIEYFFNLKELDLSYTNVDDLAPISELENLIYLNFLGVEVENIDFLSNLANLEKLLMCGENVTSIDPLRDLNNLETLMLLDFELETVNIFNDLESLEELHISNSNISQPDTISSLENIEFLAFSENDMTDITPIGELDNLNSLRITNQEIDDLKPLSNLNQLQKLELTRIDVSEESIENLGDLENLKELNISNMYGDYAHYQDDLEDISFLSSLSELEKLNFSQNSVNDISPLENLTSLEHLVFWGNEVNNIEAVQNLINLNYLKVGREDFYYTYYSNKIEGISPLVENEGLSYGDEVYIQNNYLDLDDDETMQNIQELKDRGVIIEYEPQAD